MEQELFFIIILITVILMLSYNLFTKSEKSKFRLSKENLDKLAETMITNDISNKTNTERFIDSNVTEAPDNMDSGSETDSDMSSLYEEEVEVDIRTDEEKKLNIKTEESTLNSCCKVECETCDFRNIDKQNPHKKPDILVNGAQDLMYGNTQNTPTEEIYTNLIPEPQQIKVNRYPLLTN